MVSLLNFVTLAVLVVHAGLLAYVVLYKRLRQIELQWLAAVIAVSALVVATFLIPPDLRIAGKFGRGFLLILGLIGLLGTFGSLMIEDMTDGAHHRRLITGWWAFISGWVVLLVLAALLSPTLTIGQPNWLLGVLPAPDLPTLITLPGMAVAAIALPALGFYLFYQALLPEVANRALYWVLESAILLTAVVLMGGGNYTLAVLGMAALVAVLIGATTAFARHRVFDIRGGLNQSIIMVLMMGFTAVTLFGILYTVTGLDLHNRPNGLSVLVGLAAVTALLLIPVRQLLEALFRRLISQPIIEPTLAMRGYSQQVAQAVELDELAQAASLTLNRVMGIRRSGLMLVNGTFDQELELLMIPGGSFGPETRGRTLNIPLSSSLFRALARDQRAVSQFDLEFDPHYRDMSEKNRTFFARLQMSAYAPIIMDNVLMGVLVCGPRQNDVAYFPADLELLTTLAHQTGFALRNARLVADLQHLNATMRSLNGGLEGANRELARLDSVKTDFVTIASHELRTPLAQIRGYTDIIDTINDQGMLDQDQTTVLVNNLRKATERMEELISAMLDVSQLDVNAMDLRFTQTATDTVLRLAIEPLTDAIKQRKQSLMVRGVKGLPPVQA
ncbi:MAG: GAF domain-containing protein, partial [Anaerolineae bacterium]|nr:GAF domain-containing protein [Anaerolineae bacterium]